jgi:hypothetical protein
VRAVLQWNEIRDPSTSLELTSQADLRILALRQRDPTGRRLGTDDLNIIARSPGRPIVVSRGNRTVTFEQSVEFPVATPGRIALQVQGAATSTMRVPLVATVPAIQQFWELRTRLFVSVLGRTDGRVVLSDFPSPEGGPGMPASALNVVTIGVAAAPGNVQSQSLRGTYPGQALKVLPDYVSFDGATERTAEAFGGSGPAAAFAAGTAAAMLSAIPPKQLECPWAALPPGELFQVPATWLDQVARRSKPKP